MKTYYCHYCQSQIFFTNDVCNTCQHPVGYIPAQQEMMTFEVTEQGWKSLDQLQQLYRPCKNYHDYNVCNWMIKTDHHTELCPSCQLTHVIPDLQEEKNLKYWARLETAKRRFLYMTQRLHIFPRSKANSDDHLGLSFHFLMPSDDNPVLTGHANGIITLNAFEADHIYRETTRISMGEDYRTLLGHFRHESGHYYFDVLIKNTPWIEPFRLLFGDERQDYNQALQQYYDQPLLTEWQNEYISAYASSHPWEDWAETWAHYLHMISTLDTAYYTGLSIQKQNPYDLELHFTECPVGGKDFDRTINNWFALTNSLNALNRSMGLRDAYPFTLSNKVLEKLSFIHQVLLAVLDKHDQDKRFCLAY